eukprot:868089-Prorocentrum_minimum.AAC.2
MEGGVEGGHGGLPEEGRLRVGGGEGEERVHASSAGGVRRGRVRYDPAHGVAHQDDRLRRHKGG